MSAAFFASPRLKQINRDWIIIYLVTLLARGISYYEVTLDSSTWMNMFHARGMFSDALTAYIIAQLINGLNRFNKSRFNFVHMIGYVAYAFILASNIENIHYNYSNLSLDDSRFLAESEFMIESITSEDLTIRWGSFLALLVGLHYVIRKIRITRVWNTNIFISQMICLAALFLVSDKYNRPYWQDYNVLEENIKALTETNTAKPLNDSPELQAGYDRAMKLNLDGESILEETRNKKPNVMMVVIEGLSETFLTPEIMPNLYKLSQENIHYPHFIFHQRFTENGLYSLLCGDMPTLYRRHALIITKGGRIRGVLRSNKSLHNKWAVVAGRGAATPCLPKVMQTIGYRTAFFQASSLTFCNKAGFMKHAGMDYRYGHLSLLKRYGRTKEERQKGIMRGFGIADLAFYPRVVKELIKFSKKDDKPWFATLMSTSTHFPLYIDRDLDFPMTNKRNRAYYTADHELGKLIENLKKNNLMDNTLLIVTGDESAAFPSQKNAEGMIANNWGLMVIVTPNKMKYTSDEFFTQSDVMTSILDYVGHPEESLRGRSMFRKYDDFRPLLFANIRTDRFYAWHEPEKIISCTGFFNKCRSFLVKGDNILDGELEVDPNGDKKTIDYYINVAKKSDTTNIRKERKRRKKR